MTDLTKTKPLVGKALLQKLQDMPHLSKREKARECGYISVTAKGRLRVDVGGFLNAILEAKGISLDLESAKQRPGRAATNRVIVNKNGQLLIGSTYTKKMGLRSGDEFEIKLGYKHIRLNKVGGDAEDL